MKSRNIVALKNNRKIVSYLFQINRSTLKDVASIETRLLLGPQSAHQSTNLQHKVARKHKYVAMQWSPTRDRQNLSGSKYKLTALIPYKKKRKKLLCYCSVLRMNFGESVAISFIRMKAQRMKYIELQHVHDPQMWKTLMGYNGHEKTQFGLVLPNGAGIRFQITNISEFTFLLCIPILRFVSQASSSSLLVAPVLSICVF